jgi:carbonic anhydrase
MCEINVELQVRRIAATPIVENAWARGQPLHLHGWIYALHDGFLRDLGPHLSSLEEREALPSIDHRVLHPAEAVSAIRRQAQEAFSALAPCCGPAAEK